MKNSYYILTHIKDLGRYIDLAGIPGKGWGEKEISLVILKINLLVN